MPLRLGLASLPARRDYGQVLDAVRTTLDGLGPTATEKVLGGTAVRVYRL
jgi:hypothetical protein